MAYMSCAACWLTSIWMGSFFTGTHKYEIRLCPLTTIYSQLKLIVNEIKGNSMQKLRDLDDSQTFIFQYALWKRGSNCSNTHTLCRKLAGVNALGTVIHWMEKQQEIELRSDNLVQPVIIDCRNQMQPLSSVKDTKNFILDYYLWVRLSNPSTPIEAALCRQLAPLTSGNEIISWIHNDPRSIAIDTLVQPVKVNFRGIL